MKSEIIITFLIIIFGVTGVTGISFAADEQPPVQKALEDVKEKIEDLVTAKDENSTSDDLALRIEAFKKVIDLSIAEGADLKLKLLGYDNLGEDLIIWKESKLQDLNDSLKFYEVQKTILTEKTSIDLEFVKEKAKEFKSWREENYLKTAGEINDFLLLKQEAKALEVALKRLEKITDDLIKIEKAKIRGAGDLNKLLNQAKALISEGEEIQSKAEIAFLEKYILKPETESSEIKTEIESSRSSSSGPFDENVIEARTLTVSQAEESNASGTIIIGSEKEPTQELSIRDLVRDSLMKIKAAYQIFIEMSNLVRKLLK